MSLSNFVDVETQCAIDKELKQEDIAALDKWQRKQPHLPAPLHPIESAIFMHKCRYSIEAAKQCIDTFYTYRSHCPEFFSNLNPYDPLMQRVLDSCVMMLLPNLTPEGYLVLYTRLLDRNPDAFSLDTWVKLADMVHSLTQRQRGCVTGHVAIMDVGGAKIAHVMKCCTPSLKKALIYMQNIVPVRVKSLHIVNGVPFMDKIMSLIRPLLKKENSVRVHFGDNATIFQFVPQDILPIECGGSKFNATEYFKNVTRKEIENNADFFRLKETQLVDESKRLDKRTNFEDLLGIEGSFRNLNVD